MTHEAGHAVVARKLGVSVKYVTMFETDERSAASVVRQSAGYCAPAGDRSAIAHGHTLDALVSLAGPCAQARCQGRNLDLNRQVRGEWGSDYETAQSCLVKALLLETDPDFDPHFAGGVIALKRTQVEQLNAELSRAVSEVKNLVDDNWPAIERVAQHLLTNPITMGSEIDQIIRGDC